MENNCNAGNAFERNSNKTKLQMAIEWFTKNPDGTTRQCVEELNISATTAKVGRRKAKVAIPEYAEIVQADTEQINKSIAEASECEQKCEQQEDDEKQTKRHKKKKKKKKDHKQKKKYKKDKRGK